MILTNGLNFCMIYDSFVLLMLQDMFCIVRFEMSNCTGLAAAQGRHRGLCVCSGELWARGFSQVVDK